MKMLPIPLDKSQLVTRLRPYRKVEANELFELVNAAIQRQQTPAHPAEIAAMAFEAGRKWASCRPSTCSAPAGKSRRTWPSSQPRS